jgi:hypothetical protein
MQIHRCPVKDLTEDPAAVVLITHQEIQLPLVQALLVKVIQEERNPVPHMVAVVVVVEQLVAVMPTLMLVVLVVLVLLR